MYNIKPVVIGCVLVLGVEMFFYHENKLPEPGHQFHQGRINPRGYQSQYNIPYNINRQIDNYGTAVLATQL